MEVKQYNIDDIIFAEYNPRQLTEKQYKDLLDSILRFGLVDPLIINTHEDRKNILVGGHQRARIAKDLGFTEVPCVEVCLPYEKERELNVRLNKNVGEFDMDALANFFDVEDLLEWGFTEEELSFNLEPEQAEEDDFHAEPPSEPITKLGDLYELNEPGGDPHRVLCGDSTDSDAVARLMDGKQSELLFTSPPYSDMRDYGGDKDLSIDHLKTFIRTFYPYVKYQVINLGLQRKDNEVVEYWQDYIQEAKDCGYKFLSWNVWNRNRATSIGMQTAMFAIFHEWILVFGENRKNLNRTIPKKESSREREKYKPSTRRGKDGKLNQVKENGVRHDFSQLGSVQNIDCAITTGESDHSAMFPVELPFEYIQAMTKEGDIVTESFLGSGTTLIACQQLNRTCYGIELDEGYVDIIINRWVYYMKQNNKPFTVKRNGEDVTEEFEELSGIEQV